MPFQAQISGAMSPYTKNCFNFFVKLCGSSVNGFLSFTKGAFAMKVTYQTCCGVDVHKSFLVATIVKTTGGIEPSYQKKRFSTFNNFILEFKQWLLENNCHDVCMESTGKY